ncbi:MAG: DEAD/DEAH box helicase, partial [Proteobacteria bacterium]|nr:DEAD/DEAH box helicase [Pseudomonadota bacterium]
MNKRFYGSGKPHKKPLEKFSLQLMKPGSDKSLKPIFQKIGLPKDTQFIPDDFQLEALKTIPVSDCLVTAPTGAGKTWIAQEASKKIIMKNGKIWYGTPLKALTNSIHAAFSNIFGNDKVGILTGDFKENTDADIIIGTTEILRNQLYDAMHTGKNLECDLVILDEAHFLGDDQRGVVWEEIMIYLPVRIPLLLLSATIGNSHEVARWLESIRGKKCQVIEKFDRPVPLFPLFLHPSGTLFPLMQPSENNAKTPGLHKKVYKFNAAKKNFRDSYTKLPPFDQILDILAHYNLLPAIFFLKSRSECDQALKLCNSRLLKDHPDQKKNLLNRLDSLIKNNSHLSRHYHISHIEQKAVASHHSGHLPAWKVVVETLMAEGLLNAMFATSTVAAGVNFPARSVVILNSDRFNGMDFLPLTSSEFQQMSGRAGRRGKDNIGFAIMLPGRYMNLEYISELHSKTPDDINSQISINFSMVLNLLLSHTPEQIKILLEKSFAAFQINFDNKKSIKKRSGKALKKFGTGLEFLWHDFMDHLDFLKTYHFVSVDGQLTDDGLWASKLRIDAPLLVAQSIRLNLLPHSDPALLAAIICAFVNEKEFSDDPLYLSTISKRLKDCFLGI